MHKKVSARTIEVYTSTGSSIVADLTIRMADGDDYDEVMKRAHQVFVEAAFDIVHGITLRPDGTSWNPQYRPTTEQSTQVEPS